MFELLLRWFIGVFIWGIDDNSVGSAKKCSLLQGVCYIGFLLLTGLTVEVKYLIAWKICYQTGILGLRIFMDNLQKNVFNWVLIRDVQSCFSNPSENILSLKLNFDAVGNTALKKTDYRDHRSNQLKMERELASLQIQNDGEKIIKLQSKYLEMFSQGVNFSKKLRTKFLLTMNLLEFFARIFQNLYYEILIFLHAFLYRQHFISNT